MKIGMANLPYNITRYVWHEKRAAAAWCGTAMRPSGRRNPKSSSHHSAVVPLKIILQADLDR